MRRFLIAGFMLLFLVESGLAEKVERPRGEDADVTVITSENLVYDNENQSAVFEKNVVVTDPGMKLMAEKLVVEFDEDSKVKFIRASGEVYIEQEDKAAWAQSATYDVVTGKVVLVGDPLIRQGRDMLQGDKITFWRDETRMICEPNARLTIYSQDAKVYGRPEGEK